MPKAGDDMGKTDHIIDIDTTGAENMIKTMRTTLTEQQMKKLIYRAFKRTGEHVKTIVGHEVPKKYRIKSKQAKLDVMKPVTTIGGNAAQVSCCIPIQGTRHSIGGKVFSAKGGRHGWKGIQYGKRYKISAHIVNDHVSILPTEIKGTKGSDGNENAPFRNLSAPKLNGVAFVRKTAKRLPIQRIVGVSTPQMPENRSRDEVQDDIMDTLTKRIEHEYDFMMSGIRR